MKVLVHSGKAGAEMGAEQGLVTVIVDALRASATLASLLEYGATEVMVVEQVEQARAEKQRRPEVLLVGERECVRCDGFDLGNSPLTGSCPQLPVPVVFTSSNCSRCCTSGAGAPRLLVGSAVNAREVMEVAGAAARELGTDLLLVAAGSAQDEGRFNLEDYLACGALIRCLAETAPETWVGNDGARAAQALFGRVGWRGLPQAFMRTDHGRRLMDLGFEQDVRWATRQNVYTAVPRLVETRGLPEGGVGAVLKAN